MSHLYGKLTDTKIKAAKTTSALQKLPDGRGLQLWITPTNARYWRLDYRFEGKRKLLALGVYPDVTLAHAREKVDAARKLLAHDIDPSEDKKAKNRAAAEQTSNSFRTVALGLIAKKRREGRAEATIEKIEWILSMLTALWPKAIGKITTPDIIAELQKVELTGKLETARRMRTVVGEIFRFGIQTGVCIHDPVSATRGAIASPKVVHRPAILSAAPLTDLLVKVDEYAARNVVVGAALKLMCLLYPRPGELRFAVWKEFDLDAAIWNIPGERMKMRRPHSVPLPKQAVALLKSLKEISGPIGFVFPAIGKGQRPMSENTMNQALRRMGVSSAEHCSHGFRATASTLLNEANQFSADAIERSLAHQEEDANRRAYARGDMLGERRVMSQWWADYLDQLRPSPAHLAVGMVKSMEAAPLQH